MGIAEGTKLMRPRGVGLDGSRGVGGNGLPHGFCSGGKLSSNTTALSLPAPEGEKGRAPQWGGGKVRDKGTGIS